MAERREQPLDAAKRQVDRLRVQRLQPLEQRVLTGAEAGRAALGACGVRWSRSSSLRRCAADEAQRHCRSARQSRRRPPRPRYPPMSRPLPELAIVGGGAGCELTPSTVLGKHDIAAGRGWVGKWQMRPTCRAACGDAPPCRPCRGRGDIRRAGSRSGSCSRMVCSMTRGPAKPISAPGSAIWMSPSMA